MSKDKYGLYVIGYLLTDKGNRIRAMKYMNKHTEGFVANYINNFSTDCHGVTFTNGEYWIDNDQVQTILNDEYQKISGDPQSGDIGIKYKNSEVVHSLTRKKYGFSYEKDGISPGPFNTPILSRKLTYYRRINEKN